MLLLMGLAEGAVLARLVQFLLGWCSSCSVGALETSAPPKCDTVRVRSPIGSRPPSARFPSAVRSVSVRRPIGFRPPSVEKCWEKRCKNVVLIGNTIGDFAIFDVSVFRCFYYPHPNHLCRSEICGRITVCLVGALLALASGKAERRQVHPLKLHLKSVGEYSAVNSVYFCEICGRILSNKFCEFCVFCGKKLSSKFCEFCVFCGRPFRQTFDKIVLFCPISQAFRKKRHINSVKLNYSLYLCQYL